MTRVSTGGLRRVWVADGVAQPTEKPLKASAATSAAIFHREDLDLGWLGMLAWVVGSGLCVGFMETPFPLAYWVEPKARR